MTPKIDNEKSPLISDSNEQQPVEVHEEPKVHEGDYNDKRWEYKLIALICSCLLSVGSHYAAHMLSALKPTLKEELGISNAQFGLLQSAVSLVNTVVPFFGGIFIDVFGTGVGSIVCSSLILFGEIIVALSTYPASFPLMIVGRVVYGIGSGCIVTVQEAILAHWFSGKGLAVTVGIQIATSRLAGFLATGTVNPIAENTGFYGNAFWVSASLCGFSWIVNIVYVILLRHVGEKKKIEEIQKKLAQKNNFKPGALVRMPHVFWVITFMSFILGACWGPFLHISTELIKERFGSDDRRAAWESSTSQAVPIIISPVLGYIVDRYGKRSITTLMSSVLLLLSFFLIGFTMLSPIASLTIFSFSLTLGPVAMISALPLVLDVGLVGTALGIYKCASNIGATLLDPIAGVIQDHYGSYHQVMFAFCVAAAISVAGAIALLILDKVQLKSLLDVSAEKRKELLAIHQEKTKQVENEKAPCYSFVYIFFTFALLAASWGLYIAITVHSLSEP